MQGIREFFIMKFFIGALFPDLYSYVCALSHARQHWG